MSNDELHQLVNRTFNESNATKYEMLLKANPSLYGDGRIDVLSYQLKAAVDQNSPDLIDVLVRLGADLNTHNPIRNTCLGGSCKIEAAKRLLELGAKINHEVNGEICCHTLALAIAKGNLEMVKLLVQYDAAINGIELGMSPLDRAMIADWPEIIEYLRSIGGKTAKELGWTPPPPPELSKLMEGYFEENFGKQPMATIQSMVGTHPKINIHVVDDSYQYVFQTEGMSAEPIPIETGDEANRFVELEMILPYEWPIGPELLKTDENAWPVTWLRRLAYYPHETDEPMTTLFFYPNGSPPQPFASNTELSVWMIMHSRRDPIFVSEEKQIVILNAIPLYKEEYDLVQKHGLGELGKRFDENKIQPHQMFVRKNVGLV